MAGTFQTGASPTLRVLLIEDNLDDAQIVQRALRPAGHHVTVTRTGSAGIDAARRETYDVFVLDHRLPDMTGIRVCEALRSSGQKAPILMLSSVGDDEVAGRALDAGADDFLIKGLDFGRLLELRIREQRT